MASLVTPANGDLATAELIAQLTEDFSGLRNIPVSLTGINDASAYALTLKNAGSGSRGLIVYAADGTTVLLQADGGGVRASRTGGAAERVLTTGESGTITPSMLSATAWTAFTPAMNQGASVLTLSLIVARYIAIGKNAFVEISFTIGSAGSAGTVFEVTGIPAAIAPHQTASALYVRGGFTYIIAATGARRCGLIYPLGASTLRLVVDGSIGNDFGASPSLTAANGDAFGMWATWEIA